MEGVEYYKERGCDVDSTHGAQEKGGLLPRWLAPSHAGCFPNECPY